MPPSPGLQVPALAWAIFLALVFGVMGLDLVIAKKEGGPVKFKEALLWSAVWVSLAAFFCFGLFLWKQAGPGAASKFAAGYVLELSLSVDNLFVFILIFSHYKVPTAYRRKVLFWGILGALLLRAVFIGLGAALVSRFAWVLYLFGAFLVYTGVGLLGEKESGVDPANSPLVRFVRRLARVTPRYEGGQFWVRRKGLLWITPLLLVLLVIEVTDLVFAVDSIPAVFGVTTDPFIVYSSNIFAILGLRSMFFVLEGLMPLFRHLKTGLALILTMIGLKMLLLPWLQSSYGFHVSEIWLLGMIALILAASVLASLLFPEMPGPKTRGRGKRVIKASLSRAKR
jgi:tellurite resistance protein TerC